MPIGRLRISEQDISLMRDCLLKLVNSERAEAGRTGLQLDELAGEVASKHAQDMASGGFLSHWGSDGRKPYHRYSFAGGTDATQENAAAADKVSTFTTEAISGNLTNLHRSMYTETPPGDGHRKAILAPQHTHVGFGIAVSDDHLRLSEMYVARYVRIDKLPQVAKPRSRLFLSGKLLNSKHTLKAIDVYYEPLPSAPEINWLRTLRPYSLPDERETLFPRLFGSRIYDDGSNGTIDLGTRGGFRAPIILSRTAPGIYTIATWIQRTRNEEPFQASQVCIRCE